ncbi:hypothetical protein KM031_05865 [Gemmobacter fulvus]|uniref:Uncharacterized protein n=1 Tax=Gemmobacter fulvus TaxID=2840474 RepID=A0A975P851_9RHOB|nr:hypothetical protein [Gemmobacter fulvus]MBT9244545.1 hypothetical protein [Gemmobacter fulvus]MDQ1848925.1 hypothetical protein [Gemmobacter fulvus]QWK91409.1 hypothetical protein KM031_05865 [Gemmobacter fulvus]
MAEQNLSEFYDRVARVEKARALGYGFEADGTLGRSYYFKPVSRRRRILGPLLIVLACGFGLKAAMHHQVGDSAYHDRVMAMQASDGFERLGGVLMQADPVTLWLSDQIRHYLN